MLCLIVRRYVKETTDSNKCYGGWAITNMIEIDPMMTYEVSIWTKSTVHHLWSAVSQLFPPPYVLFMSKFRFSGRFTYTNA